MDRLVNGMLDILDTSLDIRIYYITTPVLVVNSNNILHNIEFRK